MRLLSVVATLFLWILCWVGACCGWCCAGGAGNHICSLRQHQHHAIAFSPTGLPSQSKRRRHVPSLRLYSVLREQQQQEQQEQQLESSTSGAVIKIESPEDLLQHLHPTNSARNRDTTRNITKQQLCLEGYVLRRRPVGRSLAFLVIRTTTLDNNNHHQIEALMRRQDFSEPQNFDAYLAIMQPGTHVCLRGEAQPHKYDPEGAILLVHSATYKKPNANPQHLRKVLQLVAQQSQLPMEQVATALDMTINDIVALLSLHNTTNNNNNNNHPRLLRTSAEELYYEESKTILARMTGLLDPSKLLLVEAGGHSGTTLQGKRRSSSSSMQMQMQMQERRLPAPTNLATPPPTILVDLSGSDNGRMSNKTTTTSTIVGVVKNRIRYRGNITKLQILAQNDDAAAADDDDAMDGNKLQRRRITCILHPMLLSENVTMPHMYSTLCVPGALVQIQGQAVLTNTTNEATTTTRNIFWATRLPRLLQLSSGASAGSAAWTPRTVQYAVEMTHCGNLEAAQASQALNISMHEVLRIQTEADVTRRQWMAAEIARNLQKSSNSSSSSSGGGVVVTAKMKALFKSYSDLRNKFPVIVNKEDEQSESPPRKGTLLLVNGAPRNKSSVVGSRWERTKVPQLQWMLARIGEIMNRHPARDSRRLEVVDVGGGKGHLANLVAEVYADRVNVRVIDICAKATYNGRMYAQKRDLRNIQYHAADATEVNLGKNVDLVIALHACGALSDVAIAHAVNLGASFVICPCCFRSNEFLRIPSSSSFSSTTTGEKGVARKQSVAQWLGMTESSLESIQRAAEIQGDREVSETAIHTLCAIRAQAAMDHFSQASPTSRKRMINVSIQTFPIGFSTRNFCLVGDATSVSGN